MHVTTRLRQFKMDGYSVFKGLLSENTVVNLNVIAGRYCSPDGFVVFGSEVLACHPELVLPIVANGSILDLAELIVGPFVQLDSFSMVNLSPTCEAGISWHRDTYGSVPLKGGFQRPMALNLLIYLQDLSDEVGPLRVIPGTHAKPLLMTGSALTSPNEHEVLLNLNAGDAVLIHNNLVHSRTKNFSNADRRHISIMYNLTCMRQSISYHGPALEAILEQIKATKNNRLIRLMGLDEQRAQRYNSGFMEPDEDAWRSLC